MDVIWVRIFFILINFKNDNIYIWHSQFKWLSEDLVLFEVFGSI